MLLVVWITQALWDLRILEMYLKRGLSAEEADIKLHKEICLSEDYWRVLGLQPGEDEVDGAMRRELRMRGPHASARASTRPRLPVKGMAARCWPQSAPSATPTEYGSTFTAAPVSSSPMKSIERCPWLSVNARRGIRLAAVESTTV